MINISVVGVTRLVAMTEKKRKSIDSGMKRLTQQCAAAILQTSKRRCPVGRTHKLKESGHLEKVNDYTWKVAYSAKRAARGGKAIYYGCFVGANQHHINTMNGMKNISGIKVGDEVLCQDGQYHIVVKLFRYKAPIGDDFVRIVAEYRSDRNHVLEVTKNHKILILRDGVTKWVEAKNVVIGDCVFKTKKFSWSEGTAKGYPERECVNCLKKYRNQGKKFCSVECRDEYWYVKGHNPHIGSKRSKESKKRMSESLKARIRKDPNAHVSRRVARKGFLSSHEKLLRKHLDKIGEEYIPQFSVGDCLVDFYLPQRNVIMECGGGYWHQDQERDIKRDKKILKKMEDVTIFHIHFVKKGYTPRTLNVHPLDNVFYLRLNSSMNSFVDLTRFESSKVKSVELFKINDCGKNTKKLYDFAVEGIHSYVANGIVVSNSFVEFGGGWYGGRGHPKPFLLPALRIEAPKFQKKLKQLCSGWK